MNRSPDITGNWERALEAREKGFVAIPCRLGTKIPTVKWKEWQEEMPPVDLQREWFRQQCNLAIITTGLVVFDCDDPEKVGLVLQKCGDTPHKLRTPSGGMHLGYRKRKGVEVLNSVKIKGLPIDIRTDGGLTMLPLSETEDGRYEWLGPGLLPASELPVAKVGWTRERTRKVVSAVVPEVAAPGSVLYRGQRYVDSFSQVAVAGSNGHTALFTAALKIVSFVRKLGGSEADAWQLLLYFNATKACPPWDLGNVAEERALRHKFFDALRLAR